VRDYKNVFSIFYACTMLRSITNSHLTIEPAEMLEIKTALSAACKNIIRFLLQACSRWKHFHDISMRYPESFLLSAADPFDSNCINGKPVFRATDLFPWIHILSGHSRISPKKVLEPRRGLRSSVSPRRKRVHLGSKGRSAIGSRRACRSRSGRLLWPLYLGALCR